MMYKWLPRNETSNIPSYAHTMVGVGGLVINEKSEVLVVSEKNFNYPHWKLPGGMVDPGTSRKFTIDNLNFVAVLLRGWSEEKVMYINLHVCRTHWPHHIFFLVFITFAK